MRPYYIARAVGGLFFLIGALIGCYNIWMTIRTAPRARAELMGDLPDPILARTPALQAGE
jgi:cytochrome c oxidase cbb3-type subunit 1